MGEVTSTSNILKSLDFSNSNNTSTKPKGLEKNFRAEAVARRIVVFFDGDNDKWFDSYCWVAHRLSEKIIWELAKKAKKKCKPGYSPGQLFKFLAKKEIARRA
jgi:hypothetical protein